VQRYRQNHSRPIYFGGYQKMGDEYMVNSGKRGVRGDMRISRRMGLLGKTENIPAYTGSFTLSGNAIQGYITLLSSGTLTFPAAKTVDIFLHGAGGGGCAYKGGGAGGGYTKTISDRILTGGQGYAAIIGSGGSGGVYTSDYSQASGSDGGYTQFGSNTADRANGGQRSYKSGSNCIAGDGGSGGTQGSASPGGSDGADGSGVYGGDGQGFTTRPFLGDVTPFSGMQNSGGGGPGSSTTTSYAGGDGGGGRGGTTNAGDASGHSGAVNSGGGGGGGSISAHGNGGSGGSGKIIVRWGY
jgi:hypothetical protein